MMNRMNLNPLNRNRQPSNLAPVVDGDQIFIYDVIDSWGDIWGISASEFIDALRSMDADPIHLRVNSPGGMVFEGVAMKNAIAEHSSRIIAHVDGLAASMASGIVMEADEIIMARGSFMMIHDPWSLVIGDAQDLRAEADVLDNIADTLAMNYAERSGQPLEAVRDLMRAETWLNHEQAVEQGFADSVQGDTDGSANNFNLQIFKNSPKSIGGKPGESMERSVEKALRDAGFSRKEARDFVHAGKSAVQREADIETEATSEEAEALSDWLNEIKQSKEQINA